MNTKTILFKRIFFLSMVLSLLTTFSYYFLATQKDGIYNYEPQRDRAFILSIFEKDWYWLVSEHSFAFSAEYMLDNKASNKNPENKGNLNIKVYLLNQKPVGFVVYFKESFLKGDLRFIAIDESVRGKGYANALLKYALDDLKKMGCINVRLVTRTNNIKAQNLYTKFGFHETWRDDGFVGFEKIL